MKTIRIYRTKNELLEARLENNGVYLYDEDGNLDLNGWGKICTYSTSNDDISKRIELFLEHVEIVETELSFKDWLVENALTRADIAAHKAILRKRSAEQRLEQERVRRASITKDYEELIAKGVVEVNEDNLRVVMRYLSIKNWGSWQLPKMSIGYSANQYDCDGKTAVTVILDKPLNGFTKYQYGAPRGHLSAYTPI